jgi:RNA polymerase sigma-70 factor (ECF subfamily)
MDSDEQLLQRFVDGDERAFEQLVVRYESRVRNLAFGFVRDAGLAEDIAQEAFMRAYRGAARFRGGGTVKSWLYRIVANRARDELRSIKRRRESAWDEADPARVAAPETGSVERRAEAREIGRHLARALATIREDYRTPLVLREVEGLSYDEIATMLEWPVGTVKTRIHRGRHELRVLLTAMREGKSS